MKNLLLVYLYVGLGLVVPGSKGTRGTDKRFIAQYASCSDAISNCRVYSSSVCIVYKEWASKYCQATCNLCPGGNGVPKAGVFQTCKDSIPNCYKMDLSICTSTLYRPYATAKCAWTCKICTGTANVPPPPPAPTDASVFGTGTGCQLGYREIPQGQSWVIPCDYKCFCLNGTTGGYECKPLCYNWNLPSYCHMDPPIPGKCCPTPNCPSNYTITYPPGYTED